MSITGKEIKSDRTVTGGGPPKAATPLQQYYLDRFGGHVELEGIRGGYDTSESKYNFTATKFTVNSCSTTSSSSCLLVWHSQNC